MNNSFRSKRDDESDTIKPTRYYSRKQEESVAKATGAKLTKNSGATMWEKGDLQTDNWLIECKTLTKAQKSFSIKEDWFDKNLNESLLAGKEYTAVVFNFGPNKPNYYIIDENTFAELLALQKNT